MSYCVVPLKIFLEKMELNNFLQFSDQIKTDSSAAWDALSWVLMVTEKEVLEDLEEAWVTHTYT